MSDQQYPEIPVALLLGGRLQERGLGGDVQHRRGFVTDQVLGPGDERSRQAGPLRLALGYLVRVAFPQLPGQADLLAAQRDLGRCSTSMRVRP